jgi:peptidoglycan LD-endopeptidase LytH
VGLFACILALAAARPAMWPKPGAEADATSRAVADDNTDHSPGGTAAADVAGLPADDGSSAEETHAPTFLFPVAEAGLGSVVGRFGDPRDGGRRTHLGVDIAAPIGTPVVAPVAGIVERTGSGGAGGRAVWLRESGADRVYYFAHLDAIHVQAGQRVSAGHRLGTVGISGNAAGTVPHLHFTVHEGSSVLDPWWFLVSAVRLAEGPEDAAATDAARPMRTRLPGAALRSGPGRGITVAVLPRGQSVTVLGHAGGYSRVRFRGREGYVADWLLEAP